MRNGDGSIFAKRPQRKQNLTPSPTLAYMFVFLHRYMNMKKGSEGCPSEVLVWGYLCRKGERRRNRREKK